LIEGDALMKFDVQVANFPSSLDKWGAEGAEADRFHRFHRGVPPKSKGDYAFISHMVESAKEDGGKVGVIAPHGVLFRGGAEGRIRKALIEENLLDAVIGLPEKLFFGTGISAVILLFKKGRNLKDVLFIDASGEYVEGTNQNKLGEEHIKKIVAAYRAFQTVPKYAYRATREEIAENDFNLNIPRYVDTFEAEKEVDLKAVERDIEDLEKELAGVRKQMAGYLKELGIT
jgi:type I restriction enzyme M protein